MRKQVALFPDAQCYNLQTQLTDSVGNFQIKFSDKNAIYEVGIGLNDIYEASGFNREGFMLNLLSEQG
jgi:hypothetical protein